MANPMMSHFPNFILLLVLAAMMTATTTMLPRSINSCCCCCCCCSASTSLRSCLHPRRRRHTKSASSHDCPRVCVCLSCLSVRLSWDPPSIHPTTATTTPGRKIESSLFSFSPFPLTFFLFFSSSFLPLLSSCVFTCVLSCVCYY